jgi:hypothetical protein
MNFTSVWRAVELNANKADAAVRISIGRRSLAFSRRSRFDSADSSEVIPGAPACVGLGLADPLAHRLRGVDSELLRYRTAHRES